ncbi:MAG: hypothetical protein J6A59_14065 [Lachnospiraceae bacterium]|nr:hypothetical protein [Lachnospiraceae bacterium]
MNTVKRDYSWATLTLLSLILIAISMTEVNKTGAILSLIGVVLNIICVCKYTGILQIVNAIALVCGIVSISMIMPHILDINTLDGSSKSVDSIKAVSVDEDTIDIKNVNEEDIEYTPTLIKDMETEFDRNPFRANNKYLNEYVEIKCKLDTTYSSGDTITVFELNDVRDNPFRIVCNNTLAEHRDILFKLDSNEPIIIKGKVTDIDNMLGYTVEVYNILYDVQKVRLLEPEYDTSIHGMKVYEHISIDELYRQLYENAFRANKNLSGKYIETQCTIATIDSDGEYIEVGNIGTDLDGISNMSEFIEQLERYIEDLDIIIKCNVDTDIPDETLEMFNCGNEVILRGQIKEVNYPNYINYVIDLDYIGYE